MPAVVKPEGPTEINTPGRCVSRGSFWVMSLYTKADRTIKDKLNPIPCTASAAIAIGKPSISCILPALTAAFSRFPAKGAVMRRGYAGKTQTGVMVCIGKTRVDQRIRYTPLLANMAMTTHSQNMMIMVLSSHGLVSKIPY